jgi:bifunctional non-homologous end joining protein LigD
MAQPCARHSAANRTIQRQEASSLRGAHKAALPTFVPPQLATLVEAAPAGNDWLHEVKLDGYRMLARIDGARIKLVTRRGNDWSDKFGPLVAALAKLKLKSALLDGEIVHLNADGTSSFGALQKDLSEERPERLTYFLFDVLALDGYVLTGCALEDRNRVLEAIVSRAPKGPIRYSGHIIGNGSAFFAKACAASLEGIVSKRRRDPYLSGRSRSWLKVKCTGREEFVIIGWTPPGGTRHYFGSLLLGYYDADRRLHYAGRVGTGFSEERLRDVHKRLVLLERKTTPLTVRAADLPPRPHWVDPKLVVEVRFVEWTRDRHVRHPSFLGLREDKKPTEVVLDTRAGTALTPPS